MKKEYAVLVDHKAQYSANENYRPVILEAKDAVEAMLKAEAFMDETVYLIKVLERRSGIEKAEGCKKIKFEEILVNRGHGWHTCDKEHSECSAIWNRMISLSRTITWEDWEIETIRDC